MLRLEECQELLYQVTRVSAHSLANINMRVTVHCSVSHNSILISTLFLVSTCIISYLSLLFFFPKL